MKKLLINLLTFAVVIAVIITFLISFGNSDGNRYVHKGNMAQEAIAIKSKEYQCSECNMDVEILDYAAQIIDKNGNTYFFDDIGCVVLWLENHKTHLAVMLTKTLDTHLWINVKEAWYTRVASSPMGYGFAAYENKKESFIDYEEMKLLMLQGKNLHDPFVKKKLLQK